MSDDNAKSQIDAPAHGTPKRLPVGHEVDGRYEIVEFLGKGGFANVYRATQAHIDRDVALKILGPAPQGSDPAAFEARFVREAKLAAQIDHPNVVTVYDFGFTGELRQPYIAMELLDGHDLYQELKRNGGMSPERALGLFKPCLEALGEGHELGIIHKDLKPGNLFISRPGEPKEAMKILDFGVARLSEVQELDGDREASRLTSTGVIMGTPKYLPPEYIRDQLATHALDVYQMGLILVEMLSGRAVVAASSQFECLLAHAHGDLEIPRSLGDGPLGPVLVRALEMDHETRYADAMAFHEAIVDVDPADVVVDPSKGTIRVDELQSPGGPKQFTGESRPDNPMVAPSDEEMPTSGETPAAKVVADEVATTDDRGNHASDDVGSAGSGDVGAVEIHDQPTGAIDAGPPSSGRVSAEILLQNQQQTRNLVLGVVVVAILALALALYFGLRGSDSDGTTERESSAQAAERASTSESKPTERTSETAPAQDDERERQQADDDGTTGESVESPVDLVEADNPPATALRVALESEPAGAEVFLGEQRVGQTPTSLHFPGDSKTAVTITLKKDAFEPRSVTVLPRDGLVVNETLEPISDGASEGAGVDEAEENQAASATNARDSKTRTETARRDDRDDRRDRTDKPRDERSAKDRRRDEKKDDDEEDDEGGNVLMIAD